MSPAVEPPSEAFLAAVERELRKLPPGTQHAVGGGVYMRLDRAGRRRFQFRGRSRSDDNVPNEHFPWMGGKYIHT